MREREYYTMRTVEDSHWWYDALHRRLLHALVEDGLHSSGGKLLLDAGCGTGGVLRSLLRNPNFGIEAVGTDSSELALSLCGQETRRARADICTLPFQSDRFDYVVSLDVLCHAEVASDLQALCEMQRVMKKEGLLVLNLPALRWLRSSHDRAVKTTRRYTKPELRAKLAAAGLRAVRIEYWNAFLFAPAALIRLWRRRRDGVSDLHPVSPAWNALLRAVLEAERQTSRALPPPFGLSLFALARKD